MPVTFDVITPSGRLESQPCLTVAEMAEKMHTTKDAVYRKTSAGVWPYFKVVRRVYFTPEQVRQIIALSTHHVDGLPPPPEDPPAPLRSLGGGR